MQQEAKEMKNMREWIKNIEKRWENYICDESYRRRQ